MNFASWWQQNEPTERYFDDWTHEDLKAFVSRAWNAAALAGLAGRLPYADASPPQSASSSVQPGSVTAGRLAMRSPFGQFFYDTHALPDESTAQFEERQRLLSRHLPPRDQT